MCDKSTRMFGHNNSNCGQSIDLIFLDFAKAFDIVWQRGLLLKLKSIGLNGTILDWIESFLSNRIERVVICECISEWKKVLSGVGFRPIAFHNIH